MIKWVDDSYEGPQVRYTKESKRRVVSRLNRWVQWRTACLYRDAKAEWARTDTGRFPSEAELAEQARAEVEQLCRALGPWAAVDPRVLGCLESADEMLRRLMRDDLM